MSGCRVSTVQAAEAGDELGVSCSVGDSDRQHGRLHVLVCPGLDRAIVTESPSVSAGLGACAGLRVSACRPHSAHEHFVAGGEVEIGVHAAWFVPQELAFSRDVPDGHEPLLRAEGVLVAPSDRSHDPRAARGQVEHVGRPCGAAPALGAARRLVLERAVHGGAHAPARLAAPRLTEKGALTISQSETRPASACPRLACGSPEALPAVRGDPHVSASGQLTRSSAQQEAGGSSPGQMGRGWRG